MQCNVGNTDRNIRFILAIAIGALGIYFQSWWGLLAVVPLFTGAFSFCPLYKIMGINTCVNKSVQ
jgi:Protein of unknown function (DUF2892)